MVKKSYMHSFSYYLGFYKFKIFWNFFVFFLDFLKFYPGAPITNSPGITCYPQRTSQMRHRYYVLSPAHKPNAPAVSITAGM
jgi:hypothetical protein